MPKGFESTKKEKKSLIFDLTLSSDIPTVFFINQPEKKNNSRQSQICFSFNQAYGVVPQLQSVLASMLPMLGMAKLDTYKCAFASGETFYFFPVRLVTHYKEIRSMILFYFSVLCKFSEAILYYCSNKEKAPDKSIEKTMFSMQIYAAHEVFFNVWIKTADNKVINSSDVRPKKRPS